MKKALFAALLMAFAVLPARAVSVFTDDFYESETTDLVNHNSWYRQYYCGESARAIFTSSSSYAYYNAVTNCETFYTHSTGDDDPDYKVSVLIKDSGLVRLWARAGYDGSLQTSKYGYMVQFSGGNAIQLYKYVDHGTWTQLSSSISQTFNYTSDTLGIKVSDTTIQMLVNDSVIATATDSSYTAAGLIGLTLYQKSSKVSSLIVDDLEVAPTPTPTPTATPTATPSATPSSSSSATLDTETLNAIKFVSILVAFALGVIVYSNSKRR